MIAQTSLDAYGVIVETGRADTIRSEVFSFLKRVDNATGYEIAIRTGISILNVRPRLTELKQLGLIEMTAIRRGTEFAWRIIL